MGVRIWEKMRLSCILFFAFICISFAAPYGEKQLQSKQENSAEKSVKDSAKWAMPNQNWSKQDFDQKTLMKLEYSKQKARWNENDAASKKPAAGDNDKAYEKEDVVSAK